MILALTHGAQAANVSKSARIATAVVDTSLMAFTVGVQNALRLTSDRRVAHEIR